VRSEADIREVFRLRERYGWGAPRIAATTGVSATQVARWLRRDIRAVLDSPMRRSVACGPHTCLARALADEPAYVYLLGQYLGDGTIVRVGRSERLEISTTATWPGVRSEVLESIESVLGRPANTRGERDGVIRVISYSTHWPCLFPQHGPGRKHHRSIRLQPWQEAVALDRQPGKLLRGLVHSDGWRGINTVRRPGRSAPYEYARYSFDNRSDDIRAIFAAACDRLGIAWRASGRWTIYVSRREAVAMLDEHVGPKY
jgi:hypothetical protein